MAFLAAKSFWSLVIFFPILLKALDWCNGAHQMHLPEEQHANVQSWYYSGPDPVQSTIQSTQDS